MCGLSGSVIPSEAKALTRSAESKGCDDADENRRTVRESVRPIILPERWA